MMGSASGSVGNMRPDVLTSDGAPTGSKTRERCASMASGSVTMLEPSGWTVPDGGTERREVAGGATGVEADDASGRSPASAGGSGEGAAGLAGRWSRARASGLTT